MTDWREMLKREREGKFEKDTPQARHERLLDIIEAIGNEAAAVKPTILAEILAEIDKGVKEITEDRPKKPTKK